MQATDLPAIYIVKNRNNGAIDTMILTEPPCIFDDLVNTIKYVNTAVANKELVEAEWNPNSKKCKQCPFQYLCLKTKEQMTQATEAELLVAADEWREGKYFEAIAKDLLKKSKATFEEHTIASGINNWRFDNLAIGLVTVKESIRPETTIKEHQYIKITELENNSGK